jgi:hypothetical protein
MFHGLKLPCSGEGFQLSGQLVDMGLFDAGQPLKHVFPLLILGGIRCL